ncbi:MAG: NAD(P)H-dependent oxidoreductase [Spirochaetes bacterium]|nr:NAD(P)H-dependent oxidoreductase [Brevinematales bacterium]MCL1959245.1 NAD(P)H-dependent oxidoreductase [Spirochaetota bacterium]
MKTLVLFYSFSGNTRKLASQKAAETGADIEEIIEIKKMSVLKAYIVGAYRAMKRKKTEIQPIKSQFNSYEKIIIMAPVWAGNPAPAFNSIVEQLPSGKKVELVMVSAGSGTNNSAEGTKNLIAARGCEVTDYIDIKTMAKK